MAYSPRGVEEWRSGKPGTPNERPLRVFPRVTFYKSTLQPTKQSGESSDHIIRSYRVINGKTVAVTEHMPVLSLSYRNPEEVVLGVLFILARLQVLCDSRTQCNELWSTGKTPATLYPEFFFQACLSMMEVSAGSESLRSEVH